MQQMMCCIYVEWRWLLSIYCSTFFGKVHGEVLPVGCFVGDQLLKNSNCCRVDDQ